MEIAITGLGTVSSIGIGTAAFMEALAANRPKAVPATMLPDRPEYKGVWVSPIEGFDPAEHLDARVASVADRGTLLMLAAVDEAVRASGLGRNIDPDRVGVVIGTALAPVGTMADAGARLATGGASALPPKFQIAAWPNMTAAQIMLRYRLSGPLLTIATACASSLDAIGQACRMLEAHEADIVVSGGTDCAMNEVCVLSALQYGMFRPQASSATACRPFDKARDGIMVGEGAGAVILERLADARARGAVIHGVVRGAASGGDPFHISSPDPSGEGEARIMRRSIERAGLAPVDVDAVVAHATGTPIGDLAEMRAINATMGRHAQDVRVTSIKGHVGHTTGGAGVMGLIAGLGSMQRRGLVPTANTTEVDPEARFIVATGMPAPGSIDVLQVNAFGFGGQNASLVVTRD